MSELYKLSIEWVVWQGVVGDSPPSSGITLGFGPHRVSLFLAEGRFWGEGFIRYALAALTGQAVRATMFRRMEDEEFILELIPTPTRWSWLQDVELRVEDTTISLSAADLKLHGENICKALGEIESNEAIALAEDFLNGSSL